MVGCIRNLFLHNTCRLYFKKLKTDINNVKDKKKKLYLKHFCAVTYIILFLLEINYLYISPNRFSATPKKLPL